MIKWQAGANSGDDFDFTEEGKKVDNKYIQSICLSKDEKYLLVGSWKLLSVFETKTGEIKKKFELSDFLPGINFIKNGKKAIIAEENGNQSILDLETLEISSIAKNITNGKDLMKITIL